MLERYSRFEFRDGGRTREVYRRGSGPATIVLHEMPGLHPLVIRFADRLVEAGMTVFLPSLFGTPGRSLSIRYTLGEIAKTVCVRREFNVWATGRSVPMVDWLRALARHAHAECGGRGVGVVGMCFTGGFALAMMTEPAVIAPVMSQPSMPFPLLSKRRKAALDVSPQEIACAARRCEDEDLRVIGLRFRGDALVPPERFETLKAALGDRFEAIELENSDARRSRVPPHAVLTVHLVDRDGTPTKRAEQRVIAFLSNAVKP
jgi:dienelactone hydrolase